MLQLVEAAIEHGDLLENSDAIVDFRQTDAR